MTRHYIWPILVATGIFITIVSGLVWTEMMLSLGGEIDSFYGLPLPWKEGRELVCSPLHPEACQSPIFLAQFDWFVFAVDVLFYVCVGYGILFFYAKYRGKRPIEAPSQP